MKTLFRPEILHRFDEASRREWLEPNGLGGYAASSLIGANTRRYHGLLVAATRPPVGRMVLLSKLDETVLLGDARIELSCNRFPGAVSPEGHHRLASFERELHPVIVYEAGGVCIEKSIAAIHGENTTVVVWKVLEAPGPFVLELRPFSAFREDHALARANVHLRADATFENDVFRAKPYDGVPELQMLVPGAEFVPAPDWYRSFEYDLERERGLDHLEDLFTHGVFRRKLNPGDRFGVVISTGEVAGRDAAKLLDAERKRRAAIVAPIPEGDGFRRALALAADGFLVRRGESLASVIAGYPWFVDWGRDAMISLPGLLLSTGRYDDAKKVLLAFKKAMRAGLVPNRFGDRDGEPLYDTADATLWMFVATHHYLRASGDEAFVLREMLPALRDALSHHDRGTLHGIRVGPDGLLSAGEPGCALTWMDAKAGDLVFTPRSGRPVEVNALWYNAVAILADLEKRAGNEAEAKALTSRARKIKTAFARVFWNEEAGYLYDVDDHVKEASIRPNAIFAVSLPYGLLTKEQAARVLEVVDAKLLTPVGLRSLAPGDPAYRPVYQGGVAERDAAYHQGTVWTWLLGPYVDALVKVRGAAGRTQARKLLDGLATHLLEACVGQLSEIFDADPPHAARGCPAQAWSVAEVLRARAVVGAEPVAKAKAKPAAKKRSYKIVPVKGTEKSAE